MYAIMLPNNCRKKLATVPHTSQLTPNPVKFKAQHFIKTAMLKQCNVIHSCQVNNCKPSTPTKTEGMFMYKLPGN